MARLKKRTAPKDAKQIEKKIVPFPTPTAAQGISSITTTNISTGQGAYGPGTWTPTPQYGTPWNGTHQHSLNPPLPALFADEHLGELIEKLNLKPRGEMGQMTPNSGMFVWQDKYYSVVDAMLAMVTIFSAVTRPCTECGKENPHQPFDYICVKCRDDLTRKEHG